MWDGAEDLSFAEAAVGALCDEGEPDLLVRREAARRALEPIAFGRLTEAQRRAPTKEHSAFAQRVRKSSAMSGTQGRPKSDRARDLKNLQRRWVYLQTLWGEAPSSKHRRSVVPSPSRVPSRRLCVPTDLPPRGKVCFMPTRIGSSHDAEWLSCPPALTVLQRMDELAERWRLSAEDPTPKRRTRRYAATI